MQNALNNNTVMCLWPVSEKNHTARASGIWLEPIPKKLISENVYDMDPVRTFFVVNSEAHLIQPVEDMNAIFRRIDESERQDENGCGERSGVRERIAARADILEASIN